VYVFVSLYGVLATSQFWLFAGGLLDSAQSKRTFAVLNLGGILGAIVGGELTSWLLSMEAVQPVALLVVAGGLLAGTVPLASAIQRYNRKHTPSDRDSDSDTNSDDDAGGHAIGIQAVRRIRATVAEYPLVGWIAAVIAVVSVVSTVLDYQLKSLAVAAFPGEAELTAFMGRFYGRVSLVALGLQVVLSTGLRRYVRSTTALWILPGAIVLGTTAMMILPGLAAAVLLRGADQSLKHSIDKTSRELLFLPLPQAVKRRIKVPLDLVVDQTAYGAGGLLLIALVSGLGLEPVELAPVTLALAAVWIGAVYGARRAYLRQFRSGLEQALSGMSLSGESDGDARPPGSAPQRGARSHARAGLGLWPVEDDDVDASEAPRTARADVRERATQYAGRYVACGQLLALQTGAASDPDVDLRSVPSEPVLREQRQEALTGLFRELAAYLPGVQACDPDDLRLALRGLRHEDPDVRSDAVSFLDGVLSGAIRSRMVPLLDDPNGRAAFREAPPVYRFAIPYQPHASRSREPVAAARR
jgi:hypothetical protein